MKPAPGENPPRSTVKMRVDRFALAGIAMDPAVSGALLQIGFSIHGIRGADQLLDRFLARICDAIPAKRGAILLTGRNPEEFEFTTYRGEPFDVNPELAAQVLREHEAILCNDGPSILCVPLRVYDRKFGVVYLESPQAGAFERSHFHVAIAAASIAAITLEHTLYTGRLETENLRLRNELHVEHGIVGESPRMREVDQFIRKVAPTGSTILILGANGTGKELVARAIHWNSRRSTGPFVAVNCAAIPESLIESELFGSEKGAFTGAAAQRKGKIEAADGGTLFFDEIGELPMPVQAALLRFLQEREFQRVGGTRPVRVDVRVLAATNRNLEERIREERFRQDLFFRLNVVEIRMPTLAERHEDIPALTDHFIQKFRHVRVVSGITPEARRALAGYPWPGNVRELQNSMERALVLGSSEFIQAADLPREVTQANAPEQPAENRLRAKGLQFKMSAIERALRGTDGNVQEAARQLGVSPSYIYRLMREGQVTLQGPLRSGFQAE